MTANLKTCLITGGTAGIGLATAKRFADAGFCVSICGRRSEKLDEAAAALARVVGDENIFASRGDVASSDFLNQWISETVNRFGSLDVLVNNAGIAPLGDFDAIDDDRFESVLDTNIRAVFRLSKLVWPLLKRQGGTIVNVSSLAAIDPFPGFSIYGASKAWVELFTKAIATEGADHSIRACCVRPGAVETDLLRGLFPDFPAEQCVSPEDVAEIVWQCVESPEKYPSGESFEVAKT